MVNSSLNRAYLCKRRSHCSLDLRGPNWESFSNRLAHDEHRSVRMEEDISGNTAQHHPGEPGVTAATKDNEVAAELTSGLDDLVRGVALADRPASLAAGSEKDLCGSRGDPFTLFAMRTVYRMHRRDARPGIPRDGRYVDRLVGWSDTDDLDGSTRQEAGAGEERDRCLG